VDGQQKDRWCDSKIPITDTKMFFGGNLMTMPSDTFSKSASCYVSFKNQYQTGFFLAGDTCHLAIKLSAYTVIFLCS
jgi:hypothetical protein